ncbi:hypothetical protein Vi05172_g12751 [Venturia inaequalis]|nr:hypothetical protein Vi05172_g12751 [Venturia inaequalis]
MKFTAALALLAFAVTTAASPIDTPPPRCSNGCPPIYKGCPQECE